MGNSGRKKVTASELLDQLHADPEHLARSYAAEEQRRQSAERHRLAATPVVEALKDAGFQIETLDELRQSGTSYSGAIPILLKWLPLVDDFGVKEAIVRAVSVPWAKSQAAVPLVAEFRATPDVGASSLKWSIANALDIVADDTVFDQISELALDKRHGKSREMLVKALGNMTSPVSVRLLVELLNDEDVCGHAIIALGELRASESIPQIERFLDHPRAWVRKEAVKAVARLRKIRPKPGGKLR